ncbi:MAG: hypothetical protein J1F14_07930 [Treponema sp.]|nr:hypothetical protein [Treponema sp.]
MDKKTFTVLYIIISTLADILLSLGIVLALTFISGLTLTLFHVQSANAAMIVILVSFIVGVILSFIIFTKLSNLIIRKFNLENKLLPRWVRRAGTEPVRQNEAEVSYTVQDERSAPQTNMPSSVTFSEQEIEEAKKWGDDI